MLNDLTCYLDHGCHLELIAALADVGHIRKDLAFLLEFQVLALWRSALLVCWLLHCYNIIISWFECGKKRDNKDFRRSVLQCLEKLYGGLGL